MLRGEAAGYSGGVLNDATDELVLKDGLGNEILGGGGNGLRFRGGGETAVEVSKLGRRWEDGEAVGETALVSVGGGGGAFGGGGKPAKLICASSCAISRAAAALSDCSS
jgi:hypothetical protein